MKPISIRVAVRNQGHVPSFKNKKRVARNRSTGKSFLMTRKDIKQWMTRCIQSFVSQFTCLSVIGDEGTPTAPPPRCLIVSSLPLDDSVQWIPEIVIKTKQVHKGQEGAEIIIEPL
jgi:hypothetical protein